MEKMGVFDKHPSHNVLYQTQIHFCNVELKRFLLIKNAQVLFSFSFWDILDIYVLVVGKEEHRQ